MSQKEKEATILNSLSTKTLTHFFIIHFILIWLKTAIHFKIFWEKLRNQIKLDNIKNL